MSDNKPATDLQKIGDDSAKRPGPLARLRQVLQDHKVRHQSLGLQFVHADHINFLREDHWRDVVAGRSLFFDADWLRVIQDCGTDDIQHGCGLVYRDGRPVAAFQTQTLTIVGTQLVRSLDQLSDEERRQLGRKKLERRALEHLKRRIMVCGDLASWGPHGVLFRDGESPRELWPAIAEALYRQRRADRLTGRVDYVMVKDLLPEQTVQAEGLATYGYRAFETEPDMQLMIQEQWATFDDYTASLTKKYRKAARTTFDAIDKAGGTVAPLTDPRQHATAIYELYQQVVSRADVRITRLTPELLPALAESLGPERFATIGIHIADRLAGFVTVIRDGDTAVGYYLGVDYELNATLPLYHRLLFAVVEQSIAWGCRRVSFGRTALEAKARLGCEPVPTTVWIRHRVPVLNLIVRRLLQAVPHAEPPDRNPFKSAEE